MKRIIFGLIWCVLLYFGTCMVVGGVAGFIASSGAENVEDASAKGSGAGVAAVQTGRLWILFGSILTGTVASYLRILPGTKQTKTVSLGIADSRKSPREKA